MSRHDLNWTCEHELSHLTVTRGKPLYPSACQRKATHLMSTFNSLFSLFVITFSQVISKFSQTKPRNSLQGDLGGWYIELSFVARVVTYIAILGTTTSKKNKKRKGFSTSSVVLPIVLTLQDLL